MIPRKDFLQSCLLSALFLAHQQAAAFYIPGLAPNEYRENEKVPLYVNRLTPLQSDADSQLRSTVSYDYYHKAFHFCGPEDGPQDAGQESLGAVLFGDRIKTSPFELLMKKPEPCKRLPKCDTAKFDQRSAKFVNRRIWEDFAINWLVDGLPAATPYKEPDDGPEFYVEGFPLGTHKEEQVGGKPYLNNHFDIRIDYHKASEDQYRVVGVIVRPSSRRDSKYIGDEGVDCGDENDPLILNEDGETPVTWTYSVSWHESEVAWQFRWNPYLRVEDPKIHWFSLVNSAVIVMFLTGTVSAILMRALKKDFARYNRLETFNLEDFSANGTSDEDGIQEDSGWKLVHGDVFRPPKNPLLLSVFLGNGTQLFFMTAITIVFALFGFLNPSKRGSLGTAMIIWYTIFGFIGGYTSARVYKTFGGEAWKQNILYTPVFVPGIVFATFFILNFFLWAKGSAGAVPFTTMLLIVGIWFLISLPLSFAGSWIGFKRPVSDMYFLRFAS